MKKKKSNGYKEGFTSNSMFVYVNLGKNADALRLNALFCVLDDKLQDSNCFKASIEAQYWFVLKAA